MNPERESVRRFWGSARLVYFVDFLIWIASLVCCATVGRSEPILLVAQVPFFFVMTRLAERTIVRDRCVRTESPHGSLFEELACVDDPAVAESGLGRWFFRVGLPAWNAGCFVFFGLGTLFGGP